MGRARRTIAIPIELVFERTRDLWRRGRDRLAHRAIAFETMHQYIAGEDIPDWVKVEDRFFDESNAAEFQGKQF